MEMHQQPILEEDTDPDFGIQVQGADDNLLYRRSSFRSDVLGMLLRAASDSKSAISRKDAADYMQGLSESALEAGGALTHDKKMEYLRGLRDHAIHFITEAHEAGTKFLEEIKNAEEKKWITSASAERWRKRLQDGSGSWPETKTFLQKFKTEYIDNWRDLHDQLKEVEDLKKDLKANGATVAELKELEKTGFLDMHYHDKANFAGLALAKLLTMKRESKAAAEYHTRVLAILESAASEGIISHKKIGPWMAHMVSGKRSLDELRAFVVDWRRVRVKFNDIEDELKSRKHPLQGFRRRTPEAFLLLTYEDRLVYVQDAEWRIKHENDIGPDTPMKDLKGKVRHAFDTDDLDEAEYYLRKAWNIAESSDTTELLQMEQRLRRGKDLNRTDTIEHKEQDAGKEIRNAYAEIGQALSMLPGPLVPLYIGAMGMGAETTRCVTTTVYNVFWCAQRNYLTDGLIPHLRERAFDETKERTSIAGKGHGPGYENNMVSGFNTPAIRDRGHGPQNLFLNQGSFGAFLEKAKANCNVWSFWYWTNAIVDDVSISQYAYVSTNLNWIFKKNTRILEKYGLRYSTGGPPIHYASRASAGSGNFHEKTTVAA